MGLVDAKLGDATVGKHIGVGHRPGVIGPHSARQLLGVLLPIELGIGFFDQWGVARAVIGLRPGRGQAVVVNGGDGFLQQISRQPRQPVVELTGGLVGADVQRLLHQHRAGVQALIHLHQRNPRLWVTGQDGLLDGAGTPPTGQQRRVQVPTPQPGGVQHRFGQQQAIGGRHQ